MKRHILTCVAVLTLSLAAAGSARADSGAPGSTFPEQPGSHMQTACTALATNAGTSPGGVVEQNVSGTALAILNGLYIDACLGG
jgi:hypothetical protein